MENAHRCITKLVNERIESIILCPHVIGNFMYQLGGYFWMRLTLKSLSQRMAPPNVGELKASVANSELSASEGL